MKRKKYKKAKQSTGKAPRHITVNGIPREPRDMKRLARDPIEQVQSMTPEQLAELDKRVAEAKRQAYLDIIRSVAEGDQL